MKALPLVDGHLQSIQLLLVIAASQQRGTLSTLRPLDQLISDLQPEVSLLPLHVAQQCPQTMEAASHQAKQRPDIIALSMLSLVRAGVQKIQNNLKTGILDCSPDCHSVPQSSGAHHHHFGILAGQKFVHLRGPHNVQITLHIGEPQSSMLPFLYDFRRFR